MSMSASKSLRNHLLVLLGIALVAASAAAQSPSPRAGIEAVNARFSADFAKGDGVAVAGHYTVAGQVFPPNGEIVKGREAIAKFWKGVMEAGVKEAKVTTVEAESHGGTAHEVGTYVLTGEGGKTLDTGKYIVIWKRDGGQWKIHRDIWNTSMPAPK